MERISGPMATLMMGMTLLRRVPLAQKEVAANEAMAIAIGILHGCCGPNGDFSSDYRPVANG